MSKQKHDAGVKKRARRNVRSGATPVSASEARRLAGELVRRGLSSDKILGTERNFAHDR